MTTSELHARPAAGEPAPRRFGDRYVIAADRVFDGTRVLEHHAVAVRGDRITAVAPADHLAGPGPLIRFAGTVLPGFIDLHGHPLLGRFQRRRSCGTASPRSGIPVAPWWHPPAATGGCEC